MRRWLFLWITVVATLATLACGQGRMALLATRAAEHEQTDIKMALSHSGIDNLINSRVDVYGDISPDGLAGPNRHAWRSVLYQADGAYYATLMAIHTGDPDLADKALRCVETGLAHQDDDGTFDHDLKSTLRFAILGSASLSFLSQSEFAPLLEERIDLALRQFIPTGALLLEMTKDPELLEELRETANVAAGVAFVLAYLGDRFELDDFRSAGLALAYELAWRRIRGGGDLLRIGEGTLSLSDDHPTLRGGEHHDPDDARRSRRLVARR